MVQLFHIIIGCNTALFGSREVIFISCSEVGVYNTESEIGNDCHRIAQSGTNYLNSRTGFFLVSK